MGERKLRLLCSKSRGPHVIGTVHRDSGGQYLLTYQRAVRIAATRDDRQDFEAQETTEPLASARAALCSSCSMRYRLPVDDIQRSAANGRPTFKVQGRNAEARFRRRYDDNGPR